MNPKKEIVFTSEVLALIAQRDLPIETVAQQLGVSLPTLRKYLRLSFGAGFREVRSRYYDQELLPEVEVMVEGNFSPYQIRLQLEISYTRARRLILLAGGQLPERKAADEYLKRKVQHLMQTTSLTRREIVAKTGCSDSSYRHWQEELESRRSERLSKERRQRLAKEMARMVEAGAKLSEIKKQLGIGWTTYKKILEEFPEVPAVPTVRGKQKNNYRRKV